LPGEDCLLVFTKDLDSSSLQTFNSYNKEGYSELKITSYV
jgi:hypothetical protein